MVFNPWRIEMLQKLVALLAITLVCSLNLVRPVDPDGANSIRGGQTLEPLYPKVLQPINPNEPTYCNAIEVFDNGAKCEGKFAACAATSKMSARYGTPGTKTINEIHVENDLSFCGEINCSGNHFRKTQRNPCTLAATPDPLPDWPTVGHQ
jgi:hypothetical protein